MIYTAFGYDGSVRIKADLNHNNFDKGLSSMKGQVDRFSVTLKKLASTVAFAFGTAAIIKFGKDSVKAASELSNAWMGLQSIVDGQGKSFSKAKSFINDYISDGLVPLENAVTAYKNLAARGYDTEQIEKTLTALKDAAAFGRQSTYTLGEAVATAAEGLKNENSILVDNAGVTKNVAKMWDEYAKSIGTTANRLTQSQKIQAEVNGILEETKFQTGDAAKLVNTYSGQIAMLGYNFQQLKVAVGNAIMPIVQAVLPGINAVISALVKLANVFAKVTALLFGKKSTSISSGQVKEQEAIASSGIAAADATDKLADATAGAGEASKKAEKDMKGVLASFDELNILADSAASSVGGAAGGIGDVVDNSKIELPEAEEGTLFDDVEISPKLLAEVEALKEALGKIWEVFKQSWEENGPAVIEAGKRALESLYELAKSIGRAFTEAWTGGAGKEFLDSVFALLTTILNIIADIADAWKTAFDNVGKEFFESILFKFTEIFKLVTSIGEAFREAWNDGTGVEIAETILRIYTNINNTIGTIALKIREAWEANGNGVAIWSAILDVVQTVLSTIERITASTLEWAQGLNLEPLMSAFRGLLEAINPLVEVITNGLAYAYENVLLPFGKWVAEELTPVGIELVTAAIELLTSILEALEPMAEWLWENFLQPLAEWTGDLIVAALGLLADALKAISDWISENQTLVQGMIVTLGLFFAAWEISKIIEFISAGEGVVSLLAEMASAIIAITSAKIADVAAWVASTAQLVAHKIALAATTIAQGAMTAAQLAWNAAATIGATVTSALGAAFAFLTSPIGLVLVAITALVAGIALLITHWGQVKEAGAAALDFIQEKWNAAGEWFNTNVVEPVSEFFSTLWNNITTFASDARSKVQEIWTVVSGWFNDTVVTPVKEFFSAMWEEIKKLTSAAWESVKSTWNAAAQWFNTTVVEPVKKFFAALWENVKKTAAEAWEAVKNAWNAAAEWFHSTITEPIAKFFSEAWEKIKTSASEAWSNIKSGVQNFWNDLKSWWSSNAGKYFTAEYWRELGKKMVDGLLNGLKNIFSGLASWASDVWNSITSAFSGQNARASISGSMSYSSGRTYAQYAPYSARSLPHLANGAVIPPNQQFAAILGDQRSGKNIESPLSTIEQAVQNVMNRNGNTGYVGDMTVILQLNETELGRTVYRLNNKETQRVGVRLVGVKA